jgi:hypothetical protein
VIIGALADDSVTAKTPPVGGVLRLGNMLFMSVTMLVLT